MTNLEGFHEGRASNLQNELSATGFIIRVSLFRCIIRHHLHRLRIIVAQSIEAYGPEFLTIELLLRDEDDLSQKATTLEAGTQRGSQSQQLCSAFTQEQTRTCRLGQGLCEGRSRFPLSE